MKLEFKQAACVAGKDYAKGVHELPEEVLKNPYLAKLIKAGMVVEPSAQRKIDPETLEERQKRLFAKLEAAGEKRLEESYEKATESAPAMVEEKAEQAPEEMPQAFSDDEAGEPGPNDEDFSQESKKESSSRKPKKKG